MPAQLHKAELLNRRLKKVRWLVEQLMAME